MKNIEEYIKSGLLEEYVLGLTSESETLEVESLASQHAEIRNEIDSISSTLVKYSEIHAPVLDPTIKPLLMATIDYMERLRVGEEPTYPPVLTEKTTVTDFSSWINRPDMNLPEDFSDFYAKIIGYVPEGITAIVWIEKGSPAEMHDAVHEKFFILEGSCDIKMKDNVISLVAGDYYSIPLHTSHEVIVTSHTPCKAILQRLAA